MNSYNDLLQQFCAENNFVFCDSSNLCHACYYTEDGVHLNSTKGIQLLVNNQNKSVGNLIQLKNLDTLTFSRHQLNENTYRYKQNRHQTDLRFGFGANYIAKEYEQPNHHLKALSNSYIQTSESDTLTEIKNCLKLLLERSK